MPAGLRAKYYHESPPLPPSLAARADRGPAALLVPNADPAHKSDSPLPGNATCFSEAALRNRFERERKPFLRKLPGFVERPALRHPGTQLFYNFPNTGRRVCLIDEPEGCGCSGVMLEFLLQLAERDLADYLVAFIPSDCVVQVRNSLEAAFQSALPHGLRAVIGVWGEWPTDDGRVVFRKATVYRRE